MDVQQLANKLILVTGGGSGIGKECCKLAASLGAMVIVSDVELVTAEATQNELKIPEDISKKHSAIKVDVSSSESVDALCNEILKRYGHPPTIVIHCAGILGQAVETENCPAEMFQKIVNVNLYGTFLINKIFAKQMKENCLAGSIVNVSSVAKDGFAYFMPYSSTKAGLVGITKTVAQEFGVHNIRCNAVAPGAINTPMGREVPPEAVTKYVDNCALKRVGRPEEIASVCIFLGSDASSYVNGIVLEVHGGTITA